MVFAAVVQNVLSLLLAFLASEVLTPYVSRQALRCGLVDLPGARRVHAAPIPLGGGVAVFLSFFCTWLLLACAALLLPEFSPALPRWTAFFAAAFFLLMVGLLDDRRAISPLAKLFSQTIAALILFGGGFKISGALGVPPIFMLDVALTVLWFLAIINALNLIDGMDGLAAGLAGIASLSIGLAFAAAGRPDGAVLCSALAGAAFGFLRYNKNPARIFLGDAGSMFLGLCLATLPLLLGADGTVPVPALLAPLLVLAVPILDTALAVWRRSMRIVVAVLLDRPRPGGFMTADMDHLHHRLLRTGRTQRQVCMILYLTTGLLGLAAAVISGFAEARMSLLLVMAMTGIYVLVRYAAKLELWETGLAIVHCLVYCRKPRAAVACEIVLGGLVILVSTFMVVATLPPTLPFKPFVLLVLALSGLFSFAGSYGIWRLQSNAGRDGLLILLFLALGLTLGLCCSFFEIRGIDFPIVSIRMALFTLVASALHTLTVALPPRIEKLMRSRVSGTLEAASYGLNGGDTMGRVTAVSPAFDTLLDTVESAVLRQRQILNTVLSEAQVVRKGPAAEPPSPALEEESFPAAPTGEINGERVF